MNAIICTREDLAAVITAAVSDALKNSTAYSTPKPSELLTRAEAARYLNLSQDTVKRWALSGHLPEQRFGRTIRYRRADLDALLTTSKGKAQ